MVCWCAIHENPLHYHVRARTARTGRFPKEGEASRDDYDDGVSVEPQQPGADEMY